MKNEIIPNQIPSRGQSDNSDGSISPLTEETANVVGEVSNRLKLKVCGMRDPENIQGLVKLRPDFMGFIFYEKSPRFNHSLDKNALLNIPAEIHKVGVFVNASLDSVVETVDTFSLDYVQLHGEEDLTFAKTLKAKGIKLIKVFRIGKALPEVASHYEGVADYLLFDTATSQYGGSGKHFDWDILKAYKSEVPFLLSGGIAIEDLAEIRALNLPKLAGVDVNSRFETAPGVKDLKKVHALKAAL